jgi:hypothetical protein
MGQSALSVAQWSSQWIASVVHTSSIGEVHPLAPRAALPVDVGAAAPYCWQDQLVPTPDPRIDGLCSHAAAHHRPSTHAPLPLFPASPHLAAYVWHGHVLPICRRLSGAVSPSTFFYLQQQESLQKKCSLDFPCSVLREIKKIGTQKYKKLLRISTRVWYGEYMKLLLGSTPPTQKKRKSKKYDFIFNCMPMRD